MSDSPLEIETNAETATFERFGRAWTVPTQRHHKHIREIKRILRTEGALDADDIAAIYLPADEYEALVEMDLPFDGPDGLDAFASEIARHMGLGDAGNSSPSSTSS